jgi:drug/metabolite transporter (DMT)-like permease
MRPSAVNCDGEGSISCTDSSTSGALESTNRFAVIGPAIAVGWSSFVASSTSSAPRSICRVSARAWVAFAAVSTLWGMPYLFIKVAVDDGVSPIFLAWVRIVLGGAVLLGLAWRAGTLAALRGRRRWLAVFGVTEIALPFPLIAAGEQHVASSLAAIIVAAAPLFVALLALRFDASERVSGRRLVGLVVGLGGVVALVGIDVAGRGDEMLGALAVLTAAFCYAVGPMVLKRHLADLDPRASMGAALAVAALALTPPVVAAPPSSVPPASALLALAVLGLFCTAAAFVFYGALVAEAGPGRALVITYVAPVVALALGVAVLGEHVGAGAVVGLLLILAGSWLSTDGRLPPGLLSRVPGRRRVRSKGAAICDELRWVG